MASSVAAALTLIRSPAMATDYFPFILPISSSASSVSFATSRSPYTFLGLRVAGASAATISDLGRKRHGRGLLVISSASSRPTVLVAEKLGEAGLALLRDFADVDCSYNLSPEELGAKVAQSDALIVRSGTKVTREVFQASKGRLKVVGRAGVGIDNVDLQAATESGCLVVNAPTANTIAAAEHGIALLAGMARNIAQADASMKAGKSPSFTSC